jgi:F0F1-type ATP synthase membrane subunit a
MITTTAIRKNHFKTAITTAITVSLELLFLGIIGFTFEKLVNQGYRAWLGEEAQLPMKVGIVLTYVLVSDDITLFLLGLLSEYTDLL